MKEIGGYFELELKKNIPIIHSNGLFLNSGKNALEFILKSIPVIDRLWIPYFTCDVILHPIKKLNIPYSFYHINSQLEIDHEIQLESNEYLLVTNYFGIKDDYIEKLSAKYSSRLIVDNAQALYSEPLKGIKTIYSPRKFVGIPDGGIAYIDGYTDLSGMEQDISYERCSHLLKRLDLGAEAGYMDFRENSHELVNQPVRRMSNLTWSLLQSIDFDSIRKQRNENFKQLHDSLSEINKLPIPDMTTFECPMVYPFYTSDSTLKKRLIENKIFVATYWPNVLDWCEENTLEYDLANKMIAIPIDQRYAKNEMNYIIDIIKYYEKQ